MSIELFTMVEREDMQCMFEHIQIILNELRSLGRTYDNYDHIEKKKIWEVCLRNGD